MALRVFNTLTRQKENFETLEKGKVRMYVCGPTVYSAAHVGHAMSALIFDIIRRYLEYRGLEVKHVMNYTDVDDKIINRAAELGEEPQALAERYIADFDRDLESLNILPATRRPRVSQTIPQIINFIAGLIEKRKAYVAENGDVYFRIRSDAEYGKLSGRKLEEMKVGARVEIEEAKEDALDFALWKSAKPGEPAWDSPWGKGRPGWHIECSAMNLAELGEQIDIHGGGSDLIFPHHENEIAQSESLTDKQFARYWLHNGMMQFGGEKMSKSLGNIVSIEKFLEQREPDVLRLLVLNGSYRAPLQFTEETLNAAEKSLERLQTALEVFGESNDSVSGESLQLAITQTEQDFVAGMDDDFNTSNALAALFNLARAINSARTAGVNRKDGEVAQQTFKKLAGVLGLRLENKGKNEEIPEEILILAKERELSREHQQFAQADALRKKIEQLGYLVQDSANGPVLRRKNE